MGQRARCAARRRRRSRSRAGRGGDRRRGREHRAQAPLAGRRRRHDGAVGTRVDGRRSVRGHHAGRARVGLVSPLVTETPERVLAIYAHPDDPEISAGGTLARWADAGAQVSVVITTRGEKGSVDPDADLEALADLRVTETERALAHLGVSEHFHLDYGDGELFDDKELLA